ncbi:hypothetical protein TD95_003299 [Thielaviopsis punctulata]|uniref:Non-haem dioxygenase N-terminal domain-containing protein n=1 Tax=Thielaviopsis punctulata TaxID=72032 RepID=A0A0F4ZCX8_9PEZI|nr:hypothetical protein TD95_003299 [Thielaviopsis punctulata]
MSFKIPIINISAYVADPSTASKASIAAAIHSAAISPGFFQIIGHSVPQSFQASVLAHIAHFFALPQATKDAVSRAKSPCHRGYEAVGEQHLEAGFQDMKEGFTMGPERELGGYLQGPNMWPPEDQVPGFRAAMEEYIDKMRELSVAMFRLVALSLGLEETYFDEFAGSRNSIRLCRAHRYPPTSKETAAQSRGIGAHTDFGALTLLLQDSVSIESRYSIAYFNEGPASQIIECIPTCLDKDGQALYKPVTAEQHLKNRYESSY